MSDKKIKKMTTKDDILDDENTPSSGRTSSSSDSYSYLLRDLENPGNDISEEWETIERTLYQENGKHVTDPALLKECKLWRETFPHIRVTGTAIKREEGDNEVVAAESKSVQAQEDSQLPLSKIDEKREQIKKAVVSQIVERLIGKLNLNAENLENNSYKNEKIIEINSKQDKSILNVKSPEIKHEKESYYERGKNDKLHYLGTDTKLSDRDNNSTIYDDYDYDYTSNSGEARNKAYTDGLWIGSSSYVDSVENEETNKSTTILAKNEEILRSGRLKLSVTEKPCNRLKNERASDSLTSIAKPFEATKKIDKKYEGLLGRILDSKGYNVNMSGSKRSPKSGLKGFNDSLEKSPQVGLDVGKANTRKSKQLPKLNSFKNNWLSHAEENLSLLCGRSESIAGNYFMGDFHKQAKAQSCRSAINPSQYEKKCLEDLQREMSKYKFYGGKEHDEEINLRRSHWERRYNYNSPGNTQKSRSCGDLPKKTPKTKANNNNKPLKVNLEKGNSELAVRNGTKKKPGKKTTTNQTATNLQLPPIETSIICTEIIARPKISGRTLPKKYL